MSFHWWRLACVLTGTVYLLTFIALHRLSSRWNSVGYGLEQLSSHHHQLLSSSIVTAEHENSKALPPSSSSSRSPILFVHLHKSGGSTVCETMLSHQTQVNITDMLGNHDRKQIKLRNCNTELSHPHLLDKEFHTVQTCRMLLPYTMMMDEDSNQEQQQPLRRNNFLSTEVPFADAMPCPGFRSLALMREPVRRSLSHFTYEYYSEATVTRWMDKRTLGEDKTFRGFFVSGYPVVNSMVIRHLLGRARYIDTRPIDETDLEQAKRRVDLFDAFVPLEYLRHGKVLALLNRTIPEYYEGLMNSGKLVSNEKRADAKNVRFSKPFLERVAQENKYDTMLYQYMLEKLGLHHSVGTSN